MTSINALMQHTLCIWTTNGTTGSWEELLDYIVSAWELNPKRADAFRRAIEKEVGHAD